MGPVIGIKSSLFLAVLLVGCGSSNTNPVFGAGTGGAGGAGAAGSTATGGGAGEGGGAGSVVIDAGADAEVVCNDLVCDEQVSCSNNTCTVGSTTKWCRRFNGTYTWIVQAFCGTPEFPYGSTLLECDDAGLRVCCVKTGNWEVDC
jgi:hypothetical protein